MEQYLFHREFSLGGLAKTFFAPLRKIARATRIAPDMLHLSGSSWKLPSKKFFENYKLL